MPDDKTLAVWGNTQSGKTALLSSLVAPEIRSQESDFVENLEQDWLSEGKLWDTYNNRLLLGLPPVATSDEIQPMSLEHGSGLNLVLRDMRGGDVSGEGQFKKHVEDVDAVLFVLEWGAPKSQWDPIQGYVGRITSGSRKFGLAITKCERYLSNESDAWQSESGWWKSYGCWNGYEKTLSLFEDRIWPTTVFGYQDNGMPSCILNEYGDVLPYQISPRNVWAPFNWFGKELA